MKVTAHLHQSAEIGRFLRRLTSPAMVQAGAAGLTEHAHEQRRQSIVRIASYTGVPASRLAKTTRVKRASAGPDMTAEVITQDKAVRLDEYGGPVWTRDLNPGWKGGPVSSMRGVEATGWNVRRQFPGSFLAKGRVMVRRGKERDAPLKTLSMAVTANELAKPTRPNVPAAEKFAALDLEKRVVRHVLRALGT